MSSCTILNPFPCRKWRTRYISDCGESTSSFADLVTPRLSSSIFVTSAPPMPLINIVSASFSASSFAPSESLVVIQCASPASSICCFALFKGSLLISIATAPLTSFLSTRHMDVNAWSHPMSATIPPDWTLEIMHSSLSGIFILLKVVLKLAAAARMP